MLQCPGTIDSDYRDSEQSSCEHSSKLRICPVDPGSFFILVACVREMSVSELTRGFIDELPVIFVLIVVSVDFTVVDIV